MDRTVERTRTRIWLSRGVRIACAIGMAAALSGCAVYPYGTYSPYGPTYYQPAYYYPY